MVTNELRYVTHVKLCIQTHNNVYNVVILYWNKNTFKCNTARYKIISDSNSSRNVHAIFYKFACRLNKETVVLLICTR